VVEADLVNYPFIDPDTGIEGRFLTSTVTSGSDGDNLFFILLKLPGFRSRWEIVQAVFPEKKGGSRTSLFEPCRNPTLDLAASGIDSKPPIGEIWNSRRNKSCSRETVARFARNRSHPWPRRSIKERFPETFSKMSALGFLGLGIPEEFGGSGGGIVESCIVAEELARHCVSTSASWEPM
jgi:hypothetical protein